jgi:hypothetical protein
MEFVAMFGYYLIHDRLAGTSPSYSVFEQVTPTFAMMRVNRMKDDALPRALCRANVGR